MKRTLVTLALTTIASSSFAYNAQLDGGITYFNNNDHMTDFQGQFDLKGTYYFEAVQSKEAPLNEAAFLSHSSNVYAQYNYNEWKSKEYIISLEDQGSLYPLAKVKDESNIHHFIGGLEYFYEQFYFDAAIGFGQVKDKTEVKGSDKSDSYQHDYDVTTYRALVGFMPINNLLLAVGVDGYQGNDDQDNETNFAVKAKYVMPIGQAGQYLNLDANGTFGDMNNAVIGADYYFNKIFSLGGAFYLNDDDVSDYNFIAVRTKYFFNPNLAVGGEFGFSGDLQTFNVNATYRF
ncbi:putative porin [Acinetobacter silvestris]|uniref:Putative porin n=1 Tax=Acinetobacter silvestris TaxID=1977882 RepID=A0A1Y3CF27_9GAMM|nr:putative porin [Acinetobacter silvestris]OTG64224.1 putative porin [Acinetobacter silvestris]